MDKVYKIISNLLEISRKESRGFFSLLIVCIVALSLLYFPQIFNKYYTPEDSSDAARLDSLVVILENREGPVENHELFLFDPNSVSIDSLLLLGFPNRIAKTLDNYRSKGGRFYVKNDVKKIYGISDDLVDQIYAFINLPDSSSRDQIGILTRKFDLNSANIEQYEKVNMIGKVIGNRILKYRNLLGGFIYKDQLDEVYGLSGSALQNLKASSFIADEFKPRRIKINRDSVEAIRNHPYISDRLAEDIVRFRNYNSIIESEKVLASFKSIDRSNFEKLILYLDFQNYSK